MSKQAARDPEQTDILETMMGRELSAVTVMFHTAIAERLGLSVTDHKALDIILRSAPITAGELAEQTGLTTGAVTGLIDRLEKAGFVRRGRDPNDRRKVTIEPVSAPRLERDIGRLMEPMARAIHELTSSYSDAELEVIRDFVGHAITILQNATADLRAKDTPDP